MELWSSVSVQTDVEIPREVWELVQEKDIDGGADLTAALFDFLDNQYRFTVDDEEVHRTDGYDGEAVTDRPTLTSTEDTTTATIEVDVSPEARADAVERAEHTREHGYPEPLDHLNGSDAVPETPLMERVELNFRYFVEGDDVTAAACGEE